MTNIIEQVNIKKAGGHLKLSNCVDTQQHAAFRVSSFDIKEVIVSTTGASAGSRQFPPSENTVRKS